MDDKHLVAVIDFGSQYTQLIVRRVRELGYMAKLYALEDLDQIHDCLLYTSPSPRDS